MGSNVGIALPSGSYFGSCADRYEDSDLILTESCYVPGETIPAHYHESPFYCFVVTGNCFQRHSRSESFLDPSSLTYLPAGEQHENRWPQGGRCFHIEFTPARLGRLRDHVGLPVVPMDWSAGFSPWLVSRMIREFSIQDSLSSLVLEGLALELLAETARKSLPLSPAPPGWLLKARNLIRAEFRSSLCLDRIAQEVAVHPAHLARQFRRCYGSTIGEYVRRLRIEWCWQHMVSADKSLGAIAQDAGFSDQSHFTKSFKAETGMSPSEFLRRRS